MNKRHVVALIDGSEYSLLILHYIKQLLAPAAHTVTLLCIQEEFGNARSKRHTVAKSVPAQHDTDGVADQELVALLAHHQRDLEAAGFTTAVEIRFGDPIHEIDNYLDEERTDLIALTTHGRTGVQRVRLGSVAQHLIKHSALPILLYRPFGYA
ncbi:MAG: universal stress protein [Caldilineaceae bacterium]